MSLAEIDEAPYFVMVDKEVDRLSLFDSYDRARDHARYLADVLGVALAEVWRRGVFPGQSAPACVYRATGAGRMTVADIQGPRLSGSTRRGRLSPLAEQPRHARPTVGLCPP